MSDTPSDAGSAGTAIRTHFTPEMAAEAVLSTAGDLHRVENAQRLRYPRFVDRITTLKNADGTNKTDARRRVIEYMCDIKARDDLTATITYTSPDLSAKSPDCATQFYVAIDALYPGQEIKDPEVQASELAGRFREISLQSRAHRFAHGLSDEPALYLTHAATMMASSLSDDSHYVRDEGPGSLFHELSNLSNKDLAGRAATATPADFRTHGTMWDSVRDPMAQLRLSAGASYWSQNAGLISPKEAGRHKVLASSVVPAEPLTLDNLSYVLATNTADLAKTYQRQGETTTPHLDVNGSLVGLTLADEFYRQVQAGSVGEEDKVSEGGRQGHSAKSKFSEHNRKSLLSIMESAYVEHGKSYLPHEWWRHVPLDAAFREASSSPSEPQSKGWVETVTDSVGESWKNSMIRIGREHDPRTVDLDNIAIHVVGSNGDEGSASCRSGTQSAVMEGFSEKGTSVKDKSKYYDEYSVSDEERGTSGPGKVDQ